MTAIKKQRKTDTFGARLQIGLEMACLNQSDFAREIQASRTQVREWEQMDAAPGNVRMFKLMRAAEVLGVPIGWLLTGETKLEMIAVSRKLSKVTQEEAAEILSTRRTVGRKISR